MTYPIKMVVGYRPDPTSHNLARAEAVVDLDRVTVIIKPLKDDYVLFIDGMRLEVCVAERRGQASKEANEFIRRELDAKFLAAANQ